MYESGDKLILALEQLGKQVYEGKDIWDAPTT